MSLLSNMATNLDRELRELTKMLILFTSNAPTPGDIKTICRPVVLKLQSLFWHPNTERERENKDKNIKDKNIKKLLNTLVIVPFIAKLIASKTFPSAAVDIHSSCSS